MEFKMITPSDSLWSKLQEYAANCSWGAGISLARDMENSVFCDWERVIAATDKGRICGYCTAARKDCIPDAEYTPYIGYIFVDEEYRGHRLSEQLIRFAMDYLKSVGFEKVYIVSDHENLYEKYGFEVIDRKTAPWGSEEKIYVQRLY